MKAVLIILLTLLTVACAPASALKAPSEVSLGDKGPEPSVAAAPTVKSSITYQLSGDRSVLPLSIRDDGTRVFISWAPSQAIPAVFAIGEQGREEVVNGYMREDVFVIDRLYSKLVFRIDNAAAFARRKLVRER